jgi:hypothetical protein
MAKRRGATARDPKMRTQPIRDGVEQVARGDSDIRTGTKTSQQLDRAVRRAANRAPTERLSPGVYRSAGGGLVTQQGRPVQRQAQLGIPPESAGNPWAQGGQMDPGMAGQIAAGGGYMMQPGEQMGGQLGNLAGQAGMIGQGFGGATRNPKWPEGANLYELMGGGSGPVQDAMYRSPEFIQMPQASANQGGRYRLSPGVYGTREQAMNQYNQQMQQMYQPMVMPQVRKG